MLHWIAKSHSPSHFAYQWFPLYPSSLRSDITSSERHFLTILAETGNTNPVSQPATPCAITLSHPVHTSSVFFCFFFLAVICGMQDPNSLIRNRTHVPCIASTESEPLDCQGNLSFTTFTAVGNHELFTCGHRPSPPPGSSFPEGRAIGTLSCPSP